jgi:DNA-binding MarR family transcriptional regulator
LLFFVLFVAPVVLFAHFVYPEYMGSNTSSRHARQVLDAIRRIVQALRESSRAAEKGVGLSSAQLFVLHALEESPGLSLNDLAERTRTHQSSVSAVVARLSQARLVERGTASADARRAEVRLSMRGRSRLRRAPRTAQERLVLAVDALPREDRGRLAARLERLVAEMGLETAKPAAMFHEPARRKAGRRGDA